MVVNLKMKRNEKDLYAGKNTFKFMDVIKSYQDTLDWIKTANKGR